jgi:hypothetical protein
MTTLTSGGMTLLSGANHLTSTEEAEGEDMPLAVSFDVASSNNFTSSTSLVDLNASNNVVTFTAPASGNVLVVLSGMCQPDTGSTTLKVAFWGLRESTTIIAGPYEVAVHVTTGTAYYVHVTLPIQVTGLTPGNSYTYKWAHKASSSATAQVIGGSTDPRIMTVWELP